MTHPKAPCTFIVISYLGLEGGPCIGTLRPKYLLQRDMEPLGQKQVTKCCCADVLQAAQTGLPKTSSLYSVTKPLDLAFRFRVEGFRA